MKRLYAPWRIEYLMDSSAHEEGCLFCRVRDEQPDNEDNLILERSRHCYIIVNRYPYTTGHVMVACNRHVDRTSELDDAEASDMMALIARAERLLDAAYHPHGINIGANLGESAGAGIVGHLHIHLVPRWHGDTNFMTSVGETRVVSEGIEDTYQRLRKALASLS